MMPEDVLSEDEASREVANVQDMLAAIHAEVFAIPPAWFENTVLSPEEQACMDLISPSGQELHTVPLRIIPLSPED